MIYTITLNPALDYFLDYRNEKMKKWIKTDKSELIYGGKGINASVLLSQFKAKNKALILTGGATGKILLEKLKEANIDFINFDTKGETRINIKAQFDDTYELLSNSTNNNNKIAKELIQYLKKNLKANDKVMLMGSTMNNLPENIIDDISKVTKELKAEIIYDISGDKVINLMKYKPFVIKPNVKELSEIFNKKISSLKDIEKYANKLLDMGAQNVIISNDSKGAYLFNKEGAIFTEPLKINFVNGSGAGDSMISGFVYMYEESNNFTKAINFANASGAGTASVKSIADAETIKSLYKKVKCQKIK